MKVLVTIPCLLTGGTEIQTLSLVEALVAAGHAVTVAVYFEHSLVMRERYERTGARVELLSSDGVRPKGVRATTAFLWRELRRVVRTMKPEVAHVQYMAPGAIPIAILKLAGVKQIVATAHTLGDIYSQRGLKLVRFLASRVLDGFQCITLRAERSFFGSASLFDGAHKKHFSIYNTLPSYIKLADHPRQFTGPITIGVVSRLEPIKGMDLVVPAFAEIRGCFTDVRLLVVGDGSLRSEMGRQAQEWGVSDAVEFVGRQTQDQLQSYYDRIDVLLMPSRSEGFGLTAIEAMARGALVVAANTGGLTEVVTEAAGRLHQPESVTDIVAKAVELLSLPSTKLSEMSAAAIARARQFDFDTYKSKIRDWYKSIESGL